jgi:hypothetical protein
MDKILKINPPLMPNFFQYQMPPGKREDGFKFNHSIPIGELSEEEAYEFADMMKNEFIKHWRSKTSNR